MPLGNGSLVETIVAAALGTYYPPAGRKENSGRHCRATRRQMMGIRLRAKNLLMGGSGEWTASCQVARQGKLLAVIRVAHCSRVGCKRRTSSPPVQAWIDCTNVCSTAAWASWQA